MERNRTLPPGYYGKFEPNGRTFYIYGLVDPETLECRYIGKSIDPWERLKSHMNDKQKTHKVHWLQSLKRRGLEPIIVLFEMSCGNEPWDLAERFWIKRARRLGWPLTNSTDGGDGVQGLCEESRSRIATAWIGRKHSDETKQKLREAGTKRKHSEITRKRMSRAHRGRKITWVDKVASSLRKLTDSQVLEIKNRLNDGETIISLSMEYGVHRQTISKIKAGKYYERKRRGSQSGDGQGVASIQR